MPSVHPLGGGELRALRKLQCEAMPSRYVFTTERRAPMSPAGFRKMLARTGETEAFPFPVHPHMLRHACGYKLANDGQDTRALQHYLGHKNIQHTVRYTGLAADRFRSFWEDYGCSAHCARARVTLADSVHVHRLIRPGQELG